MQNQGKLNWLQNHLPDGLVADAAWLEHHGISRGLRSKYVKHGWLRPVARGVYQRPVAELPDPKEHPDLLWRHVVISLQTLMKRRIVPGGRTALEAQGFAHYLTAAGPLEVHLYSQEDMPGWLSKLPLENKFIVHGTGRLFKEPIAHPQTDAPDPQDLRANGLITQEWGHWNWPLIMSSPERAILELLDELPHRETFHQADMLMDGLRNLSPRRLHQLLTACHSVKVKRLFFWFAERHNHAWLRALDRGGIDLGSGKRMIVRGGKLDTKYNITVPETLDGGV